MYDELDDILTIDQLMEMLYIGRNTAYKLLKNSDIKCFKIGKVYKIPKQSVIDYILNKTNPKQS